MSKYEKPYLHANEGDVKEEEGGDCPPYSVYLYLSSHPNIHV